MYNVIDVSLGHLYFSLNVKPIFTQYSRCAKINLNASQNDLFM